MLSINERLVRASFINASRKEVSDLTLPPNFGDVDFEVHDYFGWRDPKINRRAYVIVQRTDGPVGIMLQQTEAAPRFRAQCSWCQDVQLPNDVQFYSARRAGAAGRNGNTVGTLICANFECSANVRKLPPMAYIGFDVHAARNERIATLRLRSSAFVDAVIDGLG
jgi:hypothetical protein